MSKVKIISGKGKISFNKEADKAKMEKKYPNVEFEKMNKLTFTIKPGRPSICSGCKDWDKGNRNKEYNLIVKVGNTEIPCLFKKFAWAWNLRGGKKKKDDIKISGGIQNKLFKFFRYEKLMNSKTKKKKRKSKKKKKTSRKYS